MKRNTIVIALAMCYMLCHAGCATISYHEYVGRMGEPRKEFSENNGTEILYEGVLVNERLVRNGAAYYHLQFEGVLAGAGRYLNLYLPHDSANKSLVFESNSKASGTRPAFLVQERYCCSKKYNDFFDPIPVRALEKNPERLFSIVPMKLKKNVTRADLPIFFVKLVFSNVFQYDIIYTVWAPSGSEATAFTWNAHLQLTYGTIDVRWVKRSRTLLVLSKAGYVFPVIVDIATSPIQLVGAIIYFGMGGAAK